MIEWQRNLFTRYERILKSFLNVLSVKFAGVARSHHLAGCVKLPEVEVAISNNGNEAYPSRELNPQKDRRNPQG